jgi:D-3-phosphoglycerate dehydrogenase
MAEASAPWVALAATEELPIVEAPVRAAVGDIAQVKTIALPYKPLEQREVMHWAKQLQGAAGLLLRSGYVTRELLEQLPDLRVIGVHGTGVDPVDVAACTERGVVVTNTPGANADAVTELTLALMIDVLRRVPQSAHATQHERAWDAARHTGGELKGRTLGLVGYGAIGRRVGTIAKAFGMSVIASDPGLTDDEIRTRGAEPTTFDALLGAADVVSLHAPAIPATHHLINAKTIAGMKPTAIIINCARGSLINENDLAAALSEGRLGGAALDVLDGEPPDPNSPIFNAPNIILTPHMAGSTHECLATIARMAGEDIARVLRGESAQHPVN